MWYIIYICLYRDILYRSYVAILLELILNPTIGKFSALYCGSDLLRESLVAGGKWLVNIP